MSAFAIQQKILNQDRVKYKEKKKSRLLGPEPPAPDDDKGIKNVNKNVKECVKECVKPVNESVENKS